MRKKKLHWRFRKGSEADPFDFLECGCKYYIYDGTVVRPCPDHDPSKNCAGTTDAE